MKFALTCFTIIFLSSKLFGQQELQYSRLIQNSIESPAALHLQGWINAGIAGGSSFSKYNPKNYSAFNLSYNLKKHDFAFRIKSEKSDYDFYSFRRTKFSLNTFYKLGKKHVFSLGADVSVLHYTVDKSKLIFHDQADSVYRFTLTTYDLDSRHAVNAGSVNLALLFYDTSGNYFIGFIAHDVTSPSISFQSSTAYGTFLSPEINVYAGFNVHPSPKIRFTTTFIYRHLDNESGFLFKEDLLLFSKYWAGVETNMNNVLRIHLGYQPLKKFNMGFMSDIQPNQKSFSGNTNFYKFTLGYVL